METTLSQAMDDLEAVAMRVKAERDALREENRRLREALDQASTSLGGAAHDLNTAGKLAAAEYYDERAQQARAALKVS